MIMRTITLIIIHCSATPEGRRLDFETCRRDHIRHRGFTDIGYHFYITRDGEIHRGRPLEKVGAHCKNHNRHSIGICYDKLAEHVRKHINMPLLYDILEKSRMFATEP